MSNLIDAYVKQVRNEATIRATKAFPDREHNESYLLGYIETTFTHTLHALNLTTDQESILLDRLTNSILRV